jgi:beta-galactosidase
MTVIERTIEMMRFWFFFLCGCFLVCFCSHISRNSFEIQIPDTGWLLWPDTAAKWQKDKIYLPAEVNLDSMPVNPPSGGWEVFKSLIGKPITLPGTVEEHYWGVFGERNFKNEYFYENQDTQVKNGNYLGVSWWWRTIEVPEQFQGKIVLLKIRGARLRAEVYLNEQLVGYNIITETSFVCDVTKAIRPGRENLLAIRITNPGGRLDWLDTQLLTWGDVQFHTSHGFGGLDRGLVLSAHDPVYVQDRWILNTSEMRTVKANARLRNSRQEPAQGTLKFEVIDPQKNKVCAESSKPFQIDGKGEIVIEEPLTYPDARLWDTSSPVLYNVRFQVQCDNGWKDESTVPFGFRWFDAKNVGDNAWLELNGERKRIISAISWGFWGINGLWPTPELAEKEVMAAKSLNLNCLQFHRNIGKTEVLDAQDRLGLLRYMEPGGGVTAIGWNFNNWTESPTTPIDPSGATGDAQTFAEKYMEEKIVRMVRDHRSHPSLVMYCMQNEISPDLRNGRIFRILKRMHQEDPSRIVVLKSGITTYNQVWMKAFDDSIYFDHGDGYSGWWDQHTVGGPGVWQDDLYTSPVNFTHRSDNRKEIVVWGEMLGAAVPDNHSMMVRQLTEKGGKSYDLKDHQEIANAYDAFLDRWDFRTAFKTSEELFLNIGDKCYDFWGRVIEAARLSEENDYLVISGWETTAIENHSGLVDNLRNYKGNPELIRQRLESVHLVVKPRALVVAAGEKAVCDLFLLNETPQSVTGHVQLSMQGPDLVKTELDTFKIPRQEKGRFVYLLKEGYETSKLDIPGTYKIELATRDGHLASRDEVLVVEPMVALSRPVTVGFYGTNYQLYDMIAKIPNVTIASYSKDGSYDLLFAASGFSGQTAQVDSTVAILGTEDDELYRSEVYGGANALHYVFSDLPRGKARVTLKFTEVFWTKPGARIFDVDLNGKTELKDFDIFAAAGGKNRACDRTFQVDAPDGVVNIEVSRVKADYAKLCAFKIEAGDSVIAVNCGGKTYVDKKGLVWNSFENLFTPQSSLLEKVAVGVPLIVMPQGEEATQIYALLLSQAGAFKYKGTVGAARAPWMGNWVFVKENPAYAGLPVNCAMKSEYQVPVSGASGVLLDGDNVKVFAGFGRDHDRNIGAAGFTCQLGKGKVIFHCVPGMNPVLLRRLVANSIACCVQ